MDGEAANGLGNGQGGCWLLVHPGYDINPVFILNKTPDGFVLLN